MRRIIPLFFFVFGFGGAQAQDPHFSQYFASPMTLNPASTGNIDGSYRVASNYRQQWWSVGDPFNTATLSFEKRILEGKLGESDRFGIGGMLMLDNSLSGGLKSTYISVSTSFHKGLGENHRIGIGFQGTYGSRVVDFSKLTFYNQFETDGFNTSLPTGEMAMASMNAYLDLNAGIMYNYEDENKLIYLGFSTYHITTPSQSLMEDQGSRIPRRYTLHAGANILTGEAFRLTAHALYQQQQKATETSVGGALGYDLAESSTLYFGLWYRINDSFYPYISYVNNGIQLGLSFDMITSSMKAASPKNGSIELSFIYNRPSRRAERKAMPWYY